MRESGLEPLAPVWAIRELDPLRAGAPARAVVELHNAGGATWRSFGDEGLRVSHHWLDPHGNAIVWDGPRLPFATPLAPGEAATFEVTLTAPRPPGNYVLRFDLVEEHRFWLSEVGVPGHDVEVTVAPRIEQRRLAVVVQGGADAVTTAALDAQDEAIVTDDPTAVAHLMAGSAPAPDWARRLLDAHAEGWAAVAPALVGDDPRPDRGDLSAYAPGGRNPRFGLSLLLPSVVVAQDPLEQTAVPEVRTVDGVPTVAPGGDALFEGRAVVRLPQRSGRPRR